jgi:hypothetical protein
VSVPAGAIAFGQRMAESLMVDTVVVRRRGAQAEDEDGELAWTYTTIYTGPCRLVLRSGVVNDVDAQSQLLAIQQPRLDVPVAGTDGVKAGDEFEITAGETVGVAGRIAGRFDQSLRTARRLPVEVWS